MNCRHNCPLHVRPGKPPRQKLDQVRRRLDFSDEVSEAPPRPGPPADKYGHFKKLSESHSSHDVEQPMYTSAELASVPDSFLEMFAHRAAAKPPKRVATPPCQEKESPEPEMPESFLEFCQERLAIAEQQPPRVPQPYKPAYDSPPHVSPPPYAYYGYDVPGSSRDGMYFDPITASTPKSTVTQRPARTPGCKGACNQVGETTAYSSYLGYDYPGAPQRGGMHFAPTVTSSPKPTLGYYPPAPMTYYCAGRSPEQSFGMEASRSPPPAAPVGLGRFAYPSSRSPPTPPTPSFGCGSMNIGTPDSTVSSGDFDDISPRRSSGRSRNPCMDDSHMKHKARKQTSTSSLACNRSNLSDTVCSDDLLKSSSPCQKCPTLRVTPVHSAVSFSSSCGNLSDIKQNISKSIEGELMAREQQERYQLEADLTRWQQARRKLVMNTANMGA